MKNDFTVWVSKIKIKTLFVVFFKCSQIKRVWSVIFELDEVSVSNFGVIFFIGKMDPKLQITGMVYPKLPLPLAEQDFKIQWEIYFLKIFFMIETLHKQIQNTNSDILISNQFWTLGKVELRICQLSHILAYFQFDPFPKSKIDSESRFEMRM